MEFGNMSDQSNATAILHPVDLIVFYSIGGICDEIKYMSSSWKM